MAVKVAVIGAGSWGTTVASLACRKGPTILWARDPEIVQEVRERHSNERYLPDVALPPSLDATQDIEEALNGSDIVVMAVPSHGFRPALRKAKPFLPQHAPVVSLTKGLEETTQLRMSQVVRQVAPDNPVAVLTGPNLAREVMAGFAAASVIAIEDQHLAHRLQQRFHTGLFRVYTNPDLIGCELGGVLKNVVAIASGMADGLGVGDNTRAAVITRGLAEITRLGVALGGQAGTFAGLTGMGDLIATCVSPQSRNRLVGEQLGLGRSIDEITRDMHMVAEGVKSARVVLELGERYRVDLPIVRWVCGVLNGEFSAGEAYRGLQPAPRSEQESD